MSEPNEEGLDFENPEAVLRHIQKLQDPFLITKAAFIGVTSLASKRCARLRAENENEIKHAVNDARTLWFETYTAEKEEAVNEANNMITLLGEIIGTIEKRIINCVRNDGRKIHINVDGAFSEKIKHAVGALEDYQSRIKIAADKTKGE